MARMLSIDTCDDCIQCYEEMVDGEPIVRCALTQREIKWDAECPPDHCPLPVVLSTEDPRRALAERILAEGQFAVLDVPQVCRALLGLSEPPAPEPVEPFGPGQDLIR